MKRFAPLIALLMANSALSSTVENPLFGYTHMLPSPFTLPAGTLVYGTDLGLGVTDFFQVGTNILSDFYKVYNAQGKVSLVDRPLFALGLTLGYLSYNYQDIDTGNPNLQVQSWLPGAVMAFEILPSVAWFWGGNLNYTNAVLQTEGIATSGYVRGATIETDVTWAYNPQKKKKNGVGNALSGGVSYDFNYKLVGYGLSHHWPGFHIGVHYYPSASQYPLQPILAGGGSVQF